MHLVPNGNRRNLEKMELEKQERQKRDDEEEVPF
jgi:hypothetical protein